MPLPILPLPQVLVATGDTETGRELAAWLAEWRYPHLLVEDGISALRFLTQPQPPGIALVDMDLDSVSGLQVIHSLRQRYQQVGTWLMLLGRQADAHGIQMAAEAGVDDFVLKPVSAPDLQVRLRVAERVQVLTQHLRAESEAARFHASHDSLTGLLSRESTLKELFSETDRVLRMKTPLAYVLIDLDTFSSVNLNYGYSAGDQILKELSRRLRRHLRTYDVAGRYGEDEFLIGMPGCAAESHASMTERMRKALFENPFDAGKDSIHVSASFGVAQSMGRSPLVVMREVERALARAKMDGRNCVREAAQTGEPDQAANRTNPGLMRMHGSDNNKPS